MMNSYPKVSIIILNWNGLEDTIECLESLKKITYPNYEVIVVDNGSEGNDVAVLREGFGDFIHIIGNDRNYGFAEGNNRGMRYCLENSNPDYILLLNNDTVVDPPFLDELVKVAESDNKIGSVQSKLIRKDSPEIIDSLGQEIFSNGIMRDIYFGKVDDGSILISEIFGACAAAALYKVKALNKTGLFDTDFFLLLEDVDLSWRIRLAGYKSLLAQESTVYHKRGISGTNFPPKVSSIKHYYGNAHAVFLAIKYYPLSALIKFLPTFLGLGILGFLYSFKVRRTRDFLRLIVQNVGKRKFGQSHPMLKNIQNRWIIKVTLVNYSKRLTLMVIKWFTQK
ncbi:MAG: Poly-beta-1,6-N-acetyl-D-glucosamine synthase [Syntrophomonadaceae bacterium]|nr:Poly-beta-1,6-N-acetyl-D-glucosamine synthase [Bacillota bacterium]